MTAESSPAAWSPVQITEGEWAGWTIWSGDPFELHAGPYYMRDGADGRPMCAFRAEAKHMNAGGFMHGGALMTFADYALFVIAGEMILRSQAQGHPRLSKGDRTRFHVDARHCHLFDARDGRTLPHANGV